MDAARSTRRLRPRPRSRQRLRNGTADHARDELIAVDVPPGHRDLDDAGLLRTRTDRGEVEVAEAVADEGGAEHAAALQSVGMTADDDVGASRGQLAREGLLHVAGTRVALDAPMEEDDDDICIGARPLHCDDERVDVLGGRQTGMSRRRGPRSDELGVEHLRRADDGDAPTLHRGDERRVGVDVVVADADDEVIGLRVLHRERLGETVRPVVASVVVRHAHRVEAARTEGVDRGRWRRGR